MSIKADQLMAMAYPSRFWLKVAYPLLAHMTAAELIVFSYLANWAGLKDKSRKWFFCPMQQIMEELSMGKSAQWGTIKSLKEKGYIKTKMIGMPPRRWILINWELVVQQIGDKCEQLIESREARREKRKKIDKLNRIAGNGFEDDDDDGLFDE